MSDLIDRYQREGSVNLTSEQRLFLIKELFDELSRVSCEITKYREWFKENATNLAVHRIGGYEFVDFPDPVSEELPANVDK